MIGTVEVNQEAWAVLAGFVQERFRVAQRRAAGQPPPWTEDTVLQREHFTNVHREMDPGTIFIRRRIAPLSGPTATFRALVYRRGLTEEAYAAVEDTLSVDDFHSPLYRRRLRQLSSPWTPAYTVSNMNRRGDKVDIVADTLIDSARQLAKWRDAGVLGSLESVRMLVDLLAGLPGTGRFIAYQAVMDLQLAGHIDPTDDWWAQVGPGSEAGLQILHGARPRDETDGAIQINRVRDHLNEPGRLSGVEGQPLPPLSAADTQNVLCEFSKYWKVLKTGKSRRRFDPTAAYVRDLDARGHGRQLDWVRELEDVTEAVDA